MANQLISDNTKLEITLKWDQVASIYDQVLRQAAKHLKLDGFRKGKVPVHLAEKELDPARVVNRVLEKLAPTVFQEELTKHEGKYQIVSQPEVVPTSTHKGEDWHITIQFAQPPKIDLKGYKTVVKKAKKEAESELKKQADQAKKDTKEAKEMPQDQQDEFKLQKIMAALLESIKPQIAELLVRQEADHRLQHVMQSLQQVKMNIDDYLKHRNLDRQQFLVQIQAEALASLQSTFILQEIQKQEKLEVSDQERQEEATKNITNVELRDRYLKEDRLKAQLDRTILARKTRDFLLSQ